MHIINIITEEEDTDNKLAAKQEVSNKNFTGKLTDKRKLNMGKRHVKCLFPMLSLLSNS